MNIICKTINDFCELINISIGENLQSTSIFASYQASYPNVSFADSKNHTKFCFAFLTPQYTAIYSGSVETSKFNDEFETLKDTCSKNRNMYIQIFDKLSYSSENNTLSLSSHIDTIQ